MTGPIAGLVQSVAKTWASSRVSRIGRGTRTETLRNLLITAANTRFGRQHGFADLAASQDPQNAYQQQIPICDYDDWVKWLGPEKAAGKILINEAWPGRVDTFCLSSGTTSGRTKYVPYSPAMQRVNRRAALDFYAAVIKAHPGAAPLVGDYLYMTGSTALARDPNGALHGDMSALTKYLAPKFLDRFTLPPRSIAALEPWGKRLVGLTDLCLATPDIAVISGIPIWQLTLMEAITAKSGRPIWESLPNLRFLIHGGMSIAPYRQRLNQLLGDHVQTLEIYAASEIGIGAFQLPGETGMRFFENYQVFYEFEGPDGQIVTGDSVEPGVHYSLLASSCTGLWRYRIGDVLCFKSVDPLVLDYVTRDKTTSAFDEKVTEKELENAMAAMEHAQSDFALGPQIGQRRHVWFIIGDHQPLPQWIAELDQHLRSGNQDYDDYRGDGRISAPIAVTVGNRGEFLEFLGRAEGGQRKFPRLLSPDEVDRLMQKYSKTTLQQ